MKLVFSNSIYQGSSKRIRKDRHRHREIRFNRSLIRVSNTLFVCHLLFLNKFLNLFRFQINRQQAPKHDELYVRLLQSVSDFGKLADTQNSLDHSLIFSDLYSSMKLHDQSQTFKNRMKTLKWRISIARLARRCVTQCWARSKRCHNATNLSRSLSCQLGWIRHPKWAMRENQLLVSQNRASAAKTAMLLTISGCSRLIIRNQPITWSLRKRVTLCRIGWHLAHLNLWSTSSSRTIEILLPRRLSHFLSGTWQM